MSKVENVADVLFAKIREVAAEDVHLRKTIKIMRREAINGLKKANGDGAAEWRKALEKIVEVSNLISLPPQVNDKGSDGTTQSKQTR